MKKNKIKLEWVDSTCGARFHAGVGFYDENTGEYSLILDAPRTLYRVKASFANSSQVKYKVYAPIKVHNKYAYGHRVEVGHGYADINTGGDIYLIIGRYAQMRLVLKGEGPQAESAYLKVA